MGRTVPSFRNVIETERQEWKSFRNALDKSERKEFDKMWDIPRLYVMACSNSCQLVPFHPIAMSILFHHYKELLECCKQVELMMNEENNGNNNLIRLLLQQSQEQKEQREQQPIRMRKMTTLFDFE